MLTDFYLNNFELKPEKNVRSGFFCRNVEEVMYIDTKRNSFTYSGNWLTASFALWNARKSSLLKEFSYVTVLRNRLLPLHIFWKQDTVTVHCRTFERKFKTLPLTFLILFIYFFLSPLPLDDNLRHQHRFIVNSDISSQIIY